jgi:hypothetical protein
LGLGNVPKGKTAVSFNWDLENYQKQESLSVLIVTWKFTKRKSRSQFLLGPGNFTKRKSCSKNLQSAFIGTWKFDQKGALFWAIAQQLLITLSFTLQV